MKLSLLGLLSFAALMACSDKSSEQNVWKEDPGDTDQCMRKVQKTFPTAHVIPVPGQKFRFLIQTSDGYILYAECLSHVTTDTTHTDTLFAPIDSNHNE